MKPQRILLWALCLLMFGSSAAMAEANVRFRNVENPFDGKIGEKLDVDLVKLLSEAGSGDLRWATLPNDPPPAFLKIESGHLVGAPDRAGTFRFQIRATDNQNSEKSDSGFIAVSVVSPPQWAEQEIDLGIANEGREFKFDLAKQVKNPAGGTLSFSATGLPGWLKISEAGLLVGTPERKHVGDYQGVVFTAKSDGGSSQATGHGTVIATIKPPKWTADVITLPDALEDGNYIQDLSKYLLVYEQGSLNFEFTVAPTWLSINKLKGTINGTPTKTHVGAASINVTAKQTVNGSEIPPSGVSATFKFNVVHVNHPPKWSATEIRLPPAYTGVEYRQDISKAASDYDGDKLNFQIVSGPAWLKMSKEGVVSGTPQKTDLAPNPNGWIVMVTDPANGSDQATLKIEVIKSPEAPYFIKHPTLLPVAKEDASYSQDLVPFIVDPDGTGVKFALVDGPGWAKVSASGVISGTPGAAHLGLNKISVQVSNKVGADISEIWIQVDHVNHAPQWVIDPVRLSVNEDSALSASIAPYVKDTDANDKVTFTVVSGPTWATLSNDGTFTGTPRKDQIGDNTYQIDAVDAQGAATRGTVIISVKHVNHPPIWTANPVVLPNAKEKTAYVAALTSFAKDVDGDPISFELITGSGPDWVKVNPNGAVTGTPARTNLGLNTFRVRITDPYNETAVAAVQVTVDKVKTAPRWRQSPVVMTDGYEGTAYSFDLTPYAVDDDNEKLAFRLVSGPDWMKVSPEGRVTGIPRKKDVGDFNPVPVFEATNSVASVQNSGVGRVNHVDQPPTINPIQIEVKEFQVAEINLNQAQYASGNGGPLTFSLVDNADWISLTEDGKLKLTPVHKHIGAYAFKFQVSEKLSAVGTINIVVKADPKMPVWKTDPIRMEAMTNIAVTGQLADKVSDPTGLKLTFGKTEGKGWLTVDAGGVISGTPKDADLGENSFKVQACNEANLCAPVTLIVNVKPGVTVDIVDLFAPVPGARAENIWLVDYSDYCSKLIGRLKANIGYFFGALKTADIHHTGIYLSADAHRWDGTPIAYKGQPMLMKWSDPELEADFRLRTDYAYSPASGGCSNCFNSPIWSLLRFYQRLPDLSEIYQKEFMVPFVPADALIVTQQLDHYKAFSPNTAQKNWTPEDYAKHFSTLNSAENKPFRINALAPTCPAGNLVTVAEKYAGSQNAYRILVDKTKGKYYEYTDCNFDMKAMLEDYAKLVAMRAYVHAKTKLKLKQTPVDVATVKLKIGGQEISGNTGAAADKWTYDATANEITIFWPLIDDSAFKPGDTIEIAYRVS